MFFSMFFQLMLSRFVVVFKKNNVLLFFKSCFIVFFFNMLFFLFFVDLFFVCFFFCVFFFVHFLFFECFTFCLFFFFNGICSVCSCSFCVFLEFLFECVVCFFSVVVWYFFEFLRNVHKFSVFFARTATFRSSPLRSIPGLFNENSYDLMQTYYCDVLWWRCNACSNQIMIYYNITHRPLVLPKPRIA